MGIRYKYRKTGIGVVDNLGAQLEKVIRGASQGSFETRYRYIAAAERFIRFAGENFKLKKLQNIQDKHLEAYAAYLKSRGCGDKYVKTDLSGIRYLHRQLPQARYSLKDGRKANKEMGLGSTPDGRADRAWTEDELTRMKIKAESLGRPDFARTMEAVRATGMRLDEAASLRRAEVEAALRTGVLRLTNTKGGRPRDVPLNGRAVSVFEAALRNSPRGGYAFTPAGVKVHVYKKELEDFIYNHREKIQEASRKETGHNLAAGEKGALTIHGLRHTFAREFLIEQFEKEILAGKDRKTANLEARKKTTEVLGHGRIRVTYIYAPNDL